MLRQILYEMKHQKMMTWVSVSGTALAIFLVMSLYICTNARSVERAPETHMHRIVVGHNFEARSPDSGGASSISQGLARRLYDGLDGVERVSYMRQWLSHGDFSDGTGETLTVPYRAVDGNFWKIYDFNFIDGRPFDQTETEDGAKVTVITRSLARAVFGEEKVAGRDIMMDMLPYRVVGVVEDTSPLLSTTYAEAYMIQPVGHDYGVDAWAGDNQAVILMKPGVTDDYIRSQVEARYRQVDAEFGKEGWSVTYHGQPYTMDVVLEGGYGSNNTPDPDAGARTRLFIYAAMILLPAINLSSMTRSRLRHRISEIGVRRAFGARRSSILGQMLGENLVITLAGGILGLALSVLFVLFLSKYFFMFGDSEVSTTLAGKDVAPDLFVLLTWQNFLLALGLCFVLNILSATVPAWMASRVNPAEAIKKVK